MPRTAVERLCALATAAALIPVWLFRWFPTQDGPSHLYNAFVLARYGDPSSVLIRSYFELNLRLFPNWTTYIIMAPLTRILPPLVVQQIVLTICIVSIAAAVLYLQKSFKPAADPTVLLGILLAFSYVLFMGFFNFIIGAALFAFTIGFWWRRRDERYVVALYASLIAIYLSHGLAFAATVLAIAILAAIERRWPVFLELLPAVVLFILDALARSGGEPLFKSFAWHVKQLLIFFAAGHMAIAVMTLLIVVTGVIVAILPLPNLRRAGGSPAGPPAAGPAASRPPRPVARPIPVAVVSAALFAAYFFVPWGYSGGGWVQAGWISERLLFLTILTLPAWIVLPRPTITGALLVTAIAAHLGATSMQIAKLNAYIRDFARCASLIRAHTTIHTIFPTMDVSPRVTPTLHLTGYLSLQTDVVDLDDYEARLPDFPLAYRSQPPNRAPDYVVLWRRAQIRNVIGYKMIFENSAIRLLQRMQ